MPKVELIPKGKKTSLLVLDGENAGPVTAGEILRFGLENGATVSEDTVTDVVREVILPGGRKKAMDLLVAQFRTEAELRSRLLQAGYGEAVVEVVFDYIKKFPYLDDVRYALHYLESAGEKKSLSEIRHRLLEKGVSEADYETALEKYRQERREAGPEADADGFGSEDLEMQTLRKLLSKKVPAGTPLTKEKKEKLYASFLRKGFGYHCIRSILKEYPTCESEAFD